jgi:MoxR-like ATPase
VLATQNPLEQEGTYPLPEAQLDRFLMQIDILYPELDAERRILLETTGTAEGKARGVITALRLKEMQNLIRRMPVSENVVEAILKLVRSARPGTGSEHADRHIAWGPGPRASQAMTLCARARALYDGRLAPSVDDVKALAEPVLQHRMALTFAARADGMNVRDVIASLVKAAI